MNNELHNAPAVGIFWHVGGVLIIAGAFLEEAQRRGRFAHFPVSAETMWRNYQLIRAVPVEMDYYEPPFGRVVFDKVTQQFHLYADMCILRDDVLVSEIRKNLNLPLDVGSEFDADYRCSTCLGVTTALFPEPAPATGINLNGTGRMRRERNVK